MVDNIHLKKVEESKLNTYFPFTWPNSHLTKMANSTPAHLFAITGRQKRGPGTLQTRD